MGGAYLCHTGSKERGVMSKTEEKNSDKKYFKALYK